MYLDNADKEDAGTGVVLSGGQWQRLALARALLRDRRDLLILDEPSAGLDAEAEYEIHRTLRDLRAGRTSVLVSWESCVTISLIPASRRSARPFSVIVGSRPLVRSQSPAFSCHPSPSRSPS